MNRQISLKTLAAFLLVIFMASCSYFKVQEEKVAPGAPGNESKWAYAGKTGIGTSYERYLNHAYSNEAETGKVSKVWFSLAQGILTETMYGLIHEAQIKELQFVVVGDGFVDSEKDDTNSEISYLYTDEQGRPLSLAYKVVNKDKDGLYEIEKHFFTDPDENTLFMRVTFNSKVNGITPYLYLNPHVGNSGSGDVARVDSKSMHAFEGNKHLTLLSSRKFEAESVGFVGVSDGLSDLDEAGVLENYYNTTGDSTGNVAAIARLKPMNENGVSYDFVIGFGESAKDSRFAASNTLEKGYKKTLAQYNGEGEYIGWSDYLAVLKPLNKLAESTGDAGKLLYASTMVLKAQEDKSNAGALIASLSNPWGETTSAERAGTGYKGVWPRDFYQCAMALLAAGDEQTSLVAFESLQKYQVTENTPGNKGTTGWFLQKTHVDGEIEWIHVQIDQSAMPIMLGWNLWKKGILTEDQAKVWYNKMLKPAADFLAFGGNVDLDFNKVTIYPPATQEERWEEQWGYSPSSTAAVISGLVCAADFANLCNDEASAMQYLNAADSYEKNIEKWMFTNNGAYTNGVANGKYFIRITQNDNPNDNAPIKANNGKAGLDETMVLDAGFLELVRYGVRNANAESILESLPELDNQELEDNLRVKYLFSFDGSEASYPGWRRYGNDGYGEDAHYGVNWGQMKPGQRGRVWPIFTGERGHYELARSIENGDTNSDKIKDTYIKALEYFANDGLMIPEQVYDGVGVTPKGYKVGEGTNSATPLAWSHAEYIKLVRSVSDGRVWDRYANVESRYSK